MEANKGGNNRGNEGRVVGPRPDGPQLVFTIAGKEVNIADALSREMSRNKGLFDYDIRREAASTPEKYKPGDDYALDWLRMFRQDGVTDEMYLRTMPKFFEWAAKPEGGFDEDFLAVAERIFDATCVDMKMGDSYRNYGSNHPSSVRRPEVDKVAYYSRAYGQLKGFKIFIWNDKSLAARRQEYIDASRDSLLIRYGDARHPLVLPRR
jgi:hypothetical protein